MVPVVTHEPEELHDLIRQVGGGREQSVPTVSCASAGQLPDDPLQTSWISQAPVSARQTVPLGNTVFEGQDALLPVHVSATSHVPADARHTVELEA